MPFTPNAVVSRGFRFQEFQFTYLISGAVDETCINKAVTLDTTAPNTVKLAGDGDAIFGRVFQFEDRKQEGLKVVTVERKFKNTLPIKAGLAADDVVAVGKTVVGAGAGEVRASGTVAAANPTVNLVIELVTIDGANYAVVEKL